ncbi:MAG TPA: hypothetical protein VF397_07875 [Pyrinomonadaceae bacterium]
MKFWFCLSILIALLVSTSCASYEEQQKLEKVLSQSVDRFHEELNNEQFHDIYSHADSSLQQRFDEAAFTSQLRSAHDQLGTISGKAMVLLAGHALSDLKWSKVFGREQIVSNVETPKSDLIIASEEFAWKTESDQPKLVSYEFRFICRKPCAIGIGLS